MDEYAQLTEHLASKLSSSEEQESATAAISRIKARASAALANVDAASTASQPSMRISTAEDGQLTVSSVSHNERYLGEVSDVQFFNLVKRVLQTQGGSYPEQGVDSYEQNGDTGDCTNTTTAGKYLELPSPETAKGLADVYFSTIHIAYPFVPGSMFTRHFNDDQSLSEDHAFHSTTQVALLCKQALYIQLIVQNRLPSD